MKRPATIALSRFSGIALLGLLSACRPADDGAYAPEADNPAVAEEPVTAIAALSPTQGHDAKGTVTFAQTPDGVRVVADLEGLTEGPHGFHIHEEGDCSAPDASSAGGHYNPTGAPHGGPDAEQHHVGDLGNLTANAQGQATMEETFTHLSLIGSNTIVGRAVIVHAGKDDLTTQPSGNAGARVACGVIQLEIP